MLRQEEVNRLMLKLSSQVGNGSQLLPGNDDQARQKAARLPSLDLCAYKRADVWPGRNYALVGNSYHLETRITDPSNDQRRAACIAMTLDQGGHRRCVFVTEALSNEGFNHILSCFERNWLNRVSPDTVIGPAYSPDGQLIAQSFAVWRCIATKVAAATEDRMAVPAGAR